MPLHLLDPQSPAQQPPQLVTLHTIEVSKGGICVRRTVLVARHCVRTTEIPQTRPLGTEPLSRRKAGIHHEVPAGSVAVDGPVGSCGLTQLV